MLVRCLYASRAVEDFAANTLDSILEQSCRNNPDRGITGMLCFADGIFVQVLEGGRDEVCDLLGAIVRDQRHRGLRLLSYDEIAERRFGGWAMGRVNMEHINPALLLKYSAKAALNPFASSGQATLALLTELVATGAILGRTK